MKNKILAILAILILFPYQSMASTNIVGAVATPANNVGTLILSNSQNIIIESIRLSPRNTTATQPNYYFITCATTTQSGTLMASVNPKLGIMLTTPIVSGTTSPITVSPYNDQLEYPCSANLYAYGQNPAPLEYSIIYSSASATTSTSTGDYDGPNFQEWLVVMGIIIFLLSFAFWRFFFKPVTTIFT